MATIKDVASLAKVSTATVSRVLNNQNVSSATKRRVKHAMMQLGYTQNQAARALKTKSTKTVGVLVPELGTTFFLYIVESMEAILEEHGYSMMLCSSNGSVEREKEKLQVLLNRNVDALVVIPVGDMGEHFVLAKKTGIPIIVVDRVLPGIDLDSVHTDGIWGTKEVVKALIREGYTRIGFLGGDEHIPTAAERYQGYLEAFKEMNLPVDQSFVFFGEMTERGGWNLMKKALSKINCPNAFFCVNDNTHLGATAYLYEKVPMQIYKKIVFGTFDFLHYFPLLKNCHYSVSQPLHDIGEKAAKLLLQRLKGDYSDFPQYVTLKPEIVVFKRNGATITDIEGAKTVDDTYYPYFTDAVFS